jgi:glyoxylase-like metal-dependent hydrolase (beta-lactamase superfamily II)
MTDIHTLDLKFQGIPGAIAVYLIPHRQGAVLVECGPGSTLPALQAALESHGFAPSDISDVLLTHIHLDHAGAAGWFAKQGARIHVHQLGAPHLLNPEKLLTSAGRIYGEMMQPLWGEFLAVPEQRLSILQDGQPVEIEGLCLRALDTPGHANHHFAYIFEDVCFTGDIGGVRLDAARHIRLPMPPPELHLESWRQSIIRLQQEYERGMFRRIAPTHFGIFDDAGWHLNAVLENLSEIEAWIDQVMPSEPAPEHLNQQFMDWTEARSKTQGLAPSLIQGYEAANPSFMSSQGILRYWRKHRSLTRQAA